MKNFSFNNYNQVERPRIFLAYPNRKIICFLNTKNLSTELCAVGISSISFKIYKYKEQQEVMGYNDISVGKYVWVDKFGWYRITDIKEENNGLNPFYTIICYDLSIELKYTYLTSFGSMGTEGDSQGGLDRYALYAPNDQAHSIAHIFMSKNPGWTFKYIDDNITKERRSFNNDSVTSYDFLTGDVADTFECIFTFDGNERTVSAYKIENFGKKLPIVLSYRNLIKEIDITWNENDIRTMFNVSGGNDVTGTALSIAAINPSGNGIITNLTYYYKDMSDELKAKLEEYYDLMDSSKGNIAVAMSQLKVLQDELSDLNNKMPSDESSTTWSEYGLVGLKAKASTYKENMSVLTDVISHDTTAKQQYDNYNSLWNVVTAEIIVRQNQISAKETQISTKKTEASSYVVNIIDVLGENLYLELQPFLKEDNFCDDSFIATESMTDNEVLVMKQSLYDHAVSELNRVCFPQFDMTVNSVNFPVLAKYKNWTNQLELGDIITIKYSDDIYIEARLLKMELDWDDFTNFHLTFSSKTSLDDGWFELEEMKKLAERSSSTLDYRTGGWNEASKQANSAYNSSLQDYLNLSMKQIISNGINQEVEIDSTGMLFKKWLPDQNKYAPEKLWITNRQIMLYEEPDGTNLKDPKVAIGKIYYTGDDGELHSSYGVGAALLIGEQIIGESLKIRNKNNTFTMDDKGLTASATNGFKVQINPDDPDNIFSIMNNSSKLMYIDGTNKKLVFKGRAEIDEGYIGGWTITNNRLYSGGVGMSSDTTAGALAFWAGNSNPSSAPYWVNNQGKVHASNIEVTGGTFKIGNNFSVASDGTLTAVNGKFSGAITGGTINIGNAFVVTSDGRVYLNSGEINLGGIVLNDTYADLGAFRITNASYGLLYSTDSNSSIQIATPDWIDSPGGPSILLNYNGLKTRIGQGGVTTDGDIWFTDPWTNGMTVLDMFKQVYDRLSQLRSFVGMGSWDN